MNILFSHVSTESNYSARGHKCPPPPPPIIHTHALKFIPSPKGKKIPVHFHSIYTENRRDGARLGVKGGGDSEPSVNAPQDSNFFFFFKGGLMSFQNFNWHSRVGAVRESLASRLPPLSAADLPHAEPTASQQATNASEPTGRSGGEETTRREDAKFSIRDAALKKGGIFRSQ